MPWAVIARRGIPLLVAVTLATFFVWPLFRMHWFQSQDMLAYPIRTIEYVADWRGGVLWPRWAPDLYGGFGAPFFNFYAPGLYILSGLLTVVGFSTVTALKLSLVALTAFGGLGTYAAVLGETRRRDAAAVGAVVFLFMGYHITQIYVRGDLSEYGAMCLCPAALYAYRALGRVPAARLRTTALLAALLHAATLLVHTITGLWLSYFLVLIVGVSACSCWLRGDRARLATLIVTFVSACGLSVIYTVPALLERPLVHIDRMIQPALAPDTHLIALEKLTLRSFHYAGRPLLYLPIVAVVVLLARRRRALPMLAWTALTIATVLSMLNGAAPLWHVIPFGSFIQFPWRLLGFTSLFGAIAVGLAWRELVELPQLVVWPLVIVVCIATGIDGWKVMPPLYPMTAAEVPSSPEAIAVGFYTTTISDEYLPIAIERPAPNPHYVLSAKSAAVISQLRSSAGGSRLEIDAYEPTSVALRTLFYPGWRVQTLSGPAPAIAESTAQGFLGLRLPAVGHYELRVSFGNTPLRSGAAAASLLSLLLFVFGVRRALRLQREPARPLNWQTLKSVLLVPPRLFVRAIARCEARPITPAEWLEPGIPKLPLLIILFTLPFILSGPVRTVMGWSLPLALVPALGLGGAVIALCAYVWRRAPPSRWTRLGAIATILPALFAVVLLYRRAFGGLTNYVGADGAVHVYLSGLFSNTEPGVYVGFVSLYSWMYWVQQLTGCNVFWALNAAFYLAVAVTAAAPMFIVLSIAERRRSRAAWMTTTLSGIAMAIVMQFAIVLPLMHYLQTDGFFTQLFGLIPLLLIWLADALIRARLLRWIAVAGGVVFYRYTYGLNLFELLLAVGVLFLADAIRRGGPIWVRLGLVATLVPLSMAAGQIFDQFKVLLPQYGWIVRFDVPLVIKGEIAAVVALVAMAVLSTIVDGRAGSVVRAIRFPIGFVIINAVLLSHIRQKWPQSQPYYICKYPVQAVVLAACAFVVIVAAQLGSLADKANWKARAALFLGGIPVGAALVYAFLLWRGGFAPYWPFFMERISGKPPYTLTRPLADLGAWERIERELKFKKKDFGGYLSWDWVMFDFMNAAFGYYHGGRAFWEHGGARMEKGYCVFWDRARAGPWSSVDNLPGPVRNEWNRLEATPHACVSYRATWDHEAIRTLCHACW